MPHQCTKCSKIYQDASEELLKGCSCGARFFYYLKQEKFDELKSNVKQVMQELEKADKDQIERDIRELTGLDERPDEPVILDLESIRVIKPGKFEIDIVNLFTKNRPLIYKLGEGKYIIDVASSLAVKGTKIKTKFSPLDEIEEEGEEDETKYEEIEAGVIEDDIEDNGDEDENNPKSDETKKEEQDYLELE